MALEKKSVINLNPEGEALTIEKFRELSGQYSISDEEAEAAVRSIHKLAKIFFLFSSEMIRNEASQNNGNAEFKSKVA